MRTGCVLAAVALLAVLGCGPTGAKKLDVSGTASYDGEPIADGDITFMPDSPSVAAEGGKIADGKYAVKVPEGKWKVVIRAGKIVPGKKDPAGGPFTAEAIPKKYNDETTLTVEVASGKTEHNFNLAK
jgi:hypothetical protein